MTVLAVGQATGPGTEADNGVSQRMQQYMALRGVSVEALTVALGSSYVDTLCKLAGCGEWTIRDIWRASRLFGIDGVLLLS